MGGQALRLGPFVGGLNTVSDPTAIADAELAQSMNFELDIDGSLVSRPPFTEIDGHQAWTERIICIAEAIFSGVYYLIGSNVNGVYYRQSGDNQPWTLITNTFRSTAAVQYANTLYMVAIPGSANPGGKWDPVGGFTAVAAIPKGMACAIHKERLFVVPGTLATSNASRVSFSNAGNFETWGGTDFIDVKQGDGTNLIDLTVFQDNLLLFKNKSTHVLAYDTRPTDAVLREISRTIGVDRQFNMVNYENQVYIFHGGWVYEIVNYDFNRLNTKVPFIIDDTSPSAFTSENVFLSLLGDRLVCRFHRNVYVYGMRTRTWSEWESVADTLHYFGPIQTLHPPTGNEYYAGFCVTAGLTSVRLYDQATSLTREEVITPTITATDTYTRSVSSGWGTTDTGQVTSVSGGSASDFSVTGTKGQIALGTVAVTRVVDYTSFTKQDWDITHSVTVPVTALTSSINYAMRARMVDASNHYLFSVGFNAAGTVDTTLFKVVAGVTTSLGTFNAGAYAPGDTFKHRFRLVGSTIQIKTWKSTALEPGGWNVSVVNTEVSATGGIQIRSSLSAGNTNTLPVNMQFDNLLIGNPGDNDKIITCSAQTKNFDMATSHTYKRLWWWGADVTTDNDIVGTATPIVFAFNVTWDMLSSRAWSSLGPWSQPLSVITSITTTQVTETGTARRFAKFLKGLRYRQINFAVQLTTEGSTIDGPARLFTMTIFTESKETVTKGVN